MVCGPYHSQKGNLRTTDPAYFSGIVPMNVLGEYILGNRLLMIMKMPTNRTAVPQVGTKADSKAARVPEPRGCYCHQSVCCKATTLIRGCRPLVPRPTPQRSHCWLVRQVAKKRPLAYPWYREFTGGG